MLHKITGAIALIGLLTVIASLLSRYMQLLPDRYRTHALVIGFTLMFLGTLWRVVSEMNSPDPDKKEE